MEEVPQNGKESSHSAHANGMNEWMVNTACCTYSNCLLMIKSYCIRNRYRTRKKSESGWSLLRKYITMHGPQNAKTSSSSWLAPAVTCQVLRKMHFHNASSTVKSINTGSTKTSRILKQSVTRRHLQILHLKRDANITWFLSHARKNKACIYLSI